VSLVDVMPTVLAVTGTPPPARALRGVDLERVLLGTADPGPRVTAMRHNAKKHYRPFREARGELNVAVRDGRWKAIWNADHDRVELYDLRADPGEQRDLGRLEAERAQHLGALARDALEAALRERAGATRRAGGIDPEARRGLKDLGYLGEGDD
jgi:arylsulfatase A-like enzyme